MDLNRHCGPIAARRSRRSETARRAFAHYDLTVLTEMWASAERNVKRLWASTFGFLVVLLGCLGVATGLASNLGLGAPFIWASVAAGVAAAVVAAVSRRKTADS